MLNEGVILDDRDVHKRIERLEVNEKEIREILNQLVVNTSVMNETIIRYDSVDNRLRELETKTATNNVILNGIRWIGIIIGGTTITTIVVALLSLLFKTNGGV